MIHTVDTDRAARSAAYTVHRMFPHGFDLARREPSCVAAARRRGVPCCLVSYQVYIDRIVLCYLKANEEE
jgi:hypothetical protein